jgi:hypothetical protein
LELWHIWVFGCSRLDNISEKTNFAVGDAHFGYQFRKLIYVSDFDFAFNLMVLLFPANKF